MEGEVSQSTNNLSTNETDPLSALKNRLARGDISIGEYEETKKFLDDTGNTAVGQQASAEAALKARLDGIGRFSLQSSRLYGKLWGGHSLRVLSTVTVEYPHFLAKLPKV